VPPTVTPPAGPKALPAASPGLSDTQLIIPVRNGTSQSLHLADVSQPSTSTKLSKFAAGTQDGVDSGPVVSPDRRSMIFTRTTASAKGALWVSGVDGSGARPLFAKLPTQCVDGIDRPAWSQKVRTQIVVSCAAGTTKGLYLLDTDGKVVRPLFEAKGDKLFRSDLTVSPDGTRVAFQGRQGVYVVPMDGSGKVRQVTTGADADPVWSPTAPGVIAYRHYLTASSWAIFLTNVDGKDVTCRRPLEPNPLGGGKLCQFTDGGTYEQDPTWSTTGTQLAFRRGPLDAAQIYVAPLDGSAAPRPIWPTTPGNQLAPAWTTR
jgi:Tol biopolymer transport system component